MCKIGKFYIHLHRKTEKYIGGVGIYNTNVALIKIVQVHLCLVADRI
jgi:hypothetical protein